MPKTITYGKNLLKKKYPTRVFITTIDIPVCIIVNLFILGNLTIIKNPVGKILFDIRILLSYRVMNLSIFDINSLYLSALVNGSTN